MSNHYVWCDPTRCVPPTHRSPLVLLPTYGMRRVETFLRHEEGSPPGLVSVVVDAPEGFAASLGTLRRWVAELESLTQPRVGVS